MSVCPSKRKRPSLEPLDLAVVPLKSFRKDPDQPRDASRGSRARQTLHCPVGMSVCPSKRKRPFLEPLDLTVIPLNGFRTDSDPPRSESDVEFERAIKGELVSRMRQIAYEVCVACKIDHKSQYRHFCKMAHPKKLVELYFDQVFVELLNGKEDTRERVWQHMNHSCSSEEVDLHKAKYCDADSFVILVSGLRDRLEKDLAHSNW